MFTFAAFEIFAVHHLIVITYH